MAHEPTLYDLTLLLTEDAPEEQRTRILSAVESSITGAGGSVERNDDWGRRPMAYEIESSPGGRVPPAPVPRSANTD